MVDRNPTSFFGGKTMFRVSTTNRHFVAPAALFATLMLATAGVAQSPENYTLPTGPIHQPVSPYSVELGFTQHHASTAAEGFLRGKAAVIQAAGNFELSASQAAILREQARALDRENDLQQTAALLTQRKLWEDARFQARKDRDARRLAGQQLAAERATTVYRDAYQLSTNDLDPITGEINWPAVLLAERFTAHRAQIERLMKQHFVYGDLQPEAAAEGARTVDLFSQSLRREIRSVPRDEYRVAQKFLMGLKYSNLSRLQTVAKAGSVDPQAVPAATLANK
jgi:hypothetical protein